MSRGQTNCVTKSFLPAAGQPAGFVDMAVQAQPGLPVQDEFFHSDAAHMHVQGGMVNGLPIQVGPVKGGLVGRGVEQEDRARQIFFSGQLDQIFLNGRVFDQIRSLRRGMPAFFGGDASGINIECLQTF